MAWNHRPPPPPAPPLDLEDRLVAWTDGACRGNPGPGAWAFLLVDPRTGLTLERACAERRTTNNRMEMTAAIEALGALRGRRRILVWSDSRYLIDTCTRWMEAWKRRGWKRGGKDPVKNLDLVQRLDELIAAHDVAWAWVHGHRGDPGNEHVDALANRAIDALERGLDPRIEARHANCPVPVPGR